MIEDNYINSFILGVVFLSGIMVGLFLHPVLYKEKHHESLNIQSYEHIIDALHNDICSYIDTLNRFDTNEWRVTYRQATGSCKDSTETQTQ